MVITSVNNNLKEFTYVEICNCTRRNAKNHRYTYIYIYIIYYVICVYVGA